MGDNLGFSLNNSWMDKQSRQRIYEFDEFRLDAGHLILSRNGEDIDIAPKAVETLLALVERRGQVVSKDELLEIVWPDAIVEESNLFSYLSHLRKALGTQKNGKPWVETLRRRGYRFNRDTHVVQTTANGNNYAWVVDSPDKSGTSIKTRSGRLYLLRDESPSRRTQTTGEPDTAASDRNEKPARVRRRRTLMAAALLGTFILGSLGFYYWRTSTRLATVPKKPIAILPFKRIDQQGEYPSLEAGLTDDLITKLSRSNNLSVRSFGSVKRFAQDDPDLAIVGKDLDVDTVLFGTLQFTPDRIRVSVRLFSVAEKTLIWDQLFEQAPSHLLDVQDEMSKRIAERLTARLTEAALKRYTDNDEAYTLYLEGKSHLLRLRPDEIGRGIANFQQAVKIDPNYAPAYTGIARGFVSLVLSTEQPPGENFEQAMAAAKKAIQIDPQLAEAHTVLGMIHLWKREWATAENAFKTALDIEPDSAFGHLYYAHLLGNLGRHDEAVAHAERARVLDPFWAYSLSIQGTIHVQAGKPNEALERFGEARRLDPNLWLAHCKAVLALIDLHRYDEALASARKASELNPRQTISLAFESFALVKLGQREEAKKILDALLTRSKAGYVPPYHIAIAYIGLDDRENALTWLEKAYDENDPILVLLKSDHFWNDLRAEPRFIDLLKKMKLE